MAELMNDIIRVGGTTAYATPFDEMGMVHEFVAPRLGISCFVAAAGPRVLGFQALQWCDPDWRGDDPLPGDWAVIATYVHGKARGSGIGRALFAETVQSAVAAGVLFIDATIRKENVVGQAYYSSLGFADYRQGADTVSKRLAPG